jgi:hypothetical protein
MLCIVLPASGAVTNMHLSTLCTCLTQLLVLLLLLLLLQARGVAAC